MSAKNVEIANTIIAQLGGAVARMMIGAKNAVAIENGLQLRFAAKAKNGANCVKIVLDASDTYTVEFYAIRGLNARKVSEESGHMDSTIKRYFERETGLYLSMR